MSNYSRNNFKASGNTNLNSNNTVNFLGIGGSLYHGALNAHSNSFNQMESSDATPVPSFGKISARGEEGGDSNSNHTLNQNNTSYLGNEWGKHNDLTHSEQSNKHL